MRLLTQTHTHTHSAIMCVNDRIVHVIGGREAVELLDREWSVIGMLVLESPFESDRNQIIRRVPTQKSCSIQYAIYL